MYLLDTNVISELRKIRTNKANPSVVQWARGVVASSLYISAITVLELEIGILQKERKDPAQGAMLRSWFTSQVLPAFNGRTLPVDSAVALRCAALHVPNPASERDAYIAATALEHNLIVVTRNVRDFTATGAKLFNPF